jgi:hypothetical protein
MDEMSKQIPMNYRWLEVVMEAFTFLTYAN